MRVCERVFSVGFGPGLDSMSPARSRLSASHAVGTHGWLPQKTGWPGLRRWIQFAQSSPTVAHQPRAGCIRLVLDFLFITFFFMSVNEDYWSRVFTTIHGVNHMRGLQNQIVLNITFCLELELIQLDKFVCTIPTQHIKINLRSKRHTWVVSDAILGPHHKAMPTPQSKGPHHKY